MNIEFEMSMVGELNFFIGLTPMSTTTKLSKDASRKYVEQKLYRTMIGILLYLTANHPSISFYVGACARY
ncbi:hypothetical protein AAG906_019481 [Vitis piasezkii]